MMKNRPYYSHARLYSWHETDKSIHGIGIFKGSSVCIHLTEAEAVQLANELLALIEKGRAKGE